MKGAHHINTLLLQSLNPGKGTFGKPHDTGLPDYIGLPVAVLLVVISVYIYFRFHRRGTVPNERDATRKLLESINRSRRRGK